MTAEIPRRASLGALGLVLLAVLTFALLRPAATMETPAGAPEVPADLSNAAPLDSPTALPADGSAAAPATNAEGPSLAPASPRLPVLEYEPLRPGTRYTYRSAAGETVVREVMSPVDLPWFDGTVKRLVPVYDSAMGGYFLYQIVGGEIRVVGTWRSGYLERWGEYILVLGQGEPTLESVQTPHGRFSDARLVEGNGQHAWYAKGIGLVKTDTLTLVDWTQGEPRESGL